MSFDYEAFDWTQLPKFAGVFPTSQAFKTAVGSNAMVTLQDGLLDCIWYVLSQEFTDTPLVYETTVLASKRLVLETISKMPHFQKRYLYWKETLDPTSVNKLDFIRLYKSTNEIDATTNKDATLVKTGTEGRVGTVDVVRSNDITDTGSSKVARTPTDVVPSTDFAEDYTNEQWKHDNAVGSDGTEGTDTTHTLTKNLTDTINDDVVRSESKDYDKQGNLESLFTVFDSIPHSLHEEICQTYVKHFLPILGLGELPE